MTRSRDTMIAELGRRHPAAADDVDAILAMPGEREATIEECAKEAERLFEKPGWSAHYKNAALTIAGMIRKLKSKSALTSEQSGPTAGTTISLSTIVDAELAAALTRSPPVSDASRWQPIETAPKDGREIEIKYLTDDPRKVRWSQSRHGSGWHLVDSSGAFILRFEPTHWRSFDINDGGVK